MVKSQTCMQAGFEILYSRQIRRKELTQVDKKETECFDKENPLWCGEKENHAELSEMDFGHQHNCNHFKGQSKCENKQRYLFFVRVLLKCLSTPQSLSFFCRVLPFRFILHSSLGFSFYVVQFCLFLMFVACIDLSNIERTFFVFA